MVRSLTEIADADRDQRSAVYQRFVAARYDADVVEPAALAGTDMNREIGTTGIWLRDVANNLCVAIIDDNFEDSRNLQLQVEGGRRTNEPVELNDDERALVTKSPYYLLVTNVLSDLPQPESRLLPCWEAHARKQIIRGAGSANSSGGVYAPTADYSVQRERVLSDFVAGWFRSWCMKAARTLSE